MFDKLSQAAEKLATGVSRRGFLGSVGRWAGATALGLAGVLTTAGAARAGGSKTCCVYSVLVRPPSTFTNCYACVDVGKPCPSCCPVGPDCFGFLSSSHTVNSCGGGDCGKPGKG